MIKKFKIFESEDAEFVKMDEFTIGNIMDQIVDDKNRVELLVMFLNKVLRNKYVSFTQKVSPRNTTTKIVDKILIKDINILLNINNDEPNMVSINVFFVDDNRKSYYVMSEENIIIWRKLGKRMITPEDPYGEEEWT